MAVKKTEYGKVVLHSIENSFLSIRNIPEYSGYGKDKKMINSSYAIYNKKKVVKSGFSNKESPANFGALIINTYVTKTNSYGPDPKKEL